MQRLYACAVIMFSFETSTGTTFVLFPYSILLDFVGASIRVWCCK